MWKNYWRTAIRNSLKNKTTSFINILGLALSIAVIILIALYINEEKGYDKWIAGSEDTYRVYRNWPDGGQVVWSPSLLAQKLVREFPEVSMSSGLGIEGEVLISHGQDKIYVDNVAAVDSTFFQVVKLPFAKGNPEIALSEPNTIVMTEHLAGRLFGDADPIGKIIEYNGDPGYMVTGVLKSGTGATHLNYEIYTPFTWYSQSWSGNNRATYIAIKPGTDITSFEMKMTASVNELVRKEMQSQNYFPSEGELPYWKLQPIQDIHLYSADFGWIGTGNGDIKYIYIFSIIGLLVLIIAIINYVNLSTAQASRRAVEIGIRKTTGASQTQVIHQFLTESVLQTFLAAVLGVLIAQFLLPAFNEITNRQTLLLGNSQMVSILITIAILSFALGLLAGFYPALVMASFKPVKVLRSHIIKSSSSGLFRRILVTTQFTITLILLIVMAFIYRQVNFMLDRDLGFKPNQVITIPMNLSDSYAKVDRLRNQFLSINGVENVTTCSRLPGMFIPDWGMLQEGRTEGLNPNVIFTDPHYLSTLDMELVSGRYLDEQIARDTVDNFIVNETFLKQYDIEDPYDVRLKFSSEDEFGKIVGVVKDFHFHGLHREIRPLIMTGLTNRWHTAIKLDSDQIDDIVDEVKSLWAQVEPEHPMRFSFLDQEFAALYDDHTRLGKSILYATLLTLVIALLGLFGLTTFALKQRVKEIGIRKILGASHSGIMMLFTRDTIKLVLLAFVIGAPIAIYLTNKWLLDFATRITVDGLTIFYAFLSVLLVTIITVGLRSFFAAMSNPVECLRND